MMIPVMKAPTTHRIRIVTTRRAMCDRFRRGCVLLKLISFRVLFRPALVMSSVAVSVIFLMVSPTPAFFLARITTGATGALESSAQVTLVALMEESSEEESSEGISSIDSAEECGRAQIG